MSDDILALALEKTGVELLPTPDVCNSGIMSILGGGVTHPLEGDGLFPPPLSHFTDGSYAKPLPNFDLKDLEDQLHQCETNNVSIPESLPFQSSNPNPVTNTTAPTTDDELSDLMNNTLKGSEYLDSLIQRDTFASYLPDSLPNALALVTDSSSAPAYDMNTVVDQVSRPSFTTTFPGPPPVDREWTGTQMITAAAEASQHQQLNWMDEPPAKVRKTMPISSEAENTRPAGLHGMEGPFDSGDRQCSCCHWLNTRMDELERKVDMILDFVTPNSQQTSCGVSQDEDEYKENGVNLLCLQAKDAYSYGQALLDILFTKEQLGESLVFQSERSSKPGLPKEKVNKLFCCIDKKYGNNYDMKLMRTKLNQKCRDSGRKVIKQLLKQVPEGHVHEADQCEEGSC